jgi:DNA-binding response OmpR family regulator
VASRFTAVVVGASQEELADLQWCLYEWECFAATLDDQEAAAPTAKLMIVYARRQQKDTLAICEQLRDFPESSAAPILLVITRNELPQGSAVERIGNATFIIAPFDQDELREKATGLLNSCS